MAFPWISVGGNSEMWLNQGREIQLECLRIGFSWISVGGNSEMWLNQGREIQLECLRIGFSWISVGGDDRGTVIITGGDY
ncbi:MAG: hypothetical protein VZR28_08330 [Candidatus Cryptobacteroides sp.]|nr:hypothetical protein [Bacteroidales bacterium]MEE3391169.1 hypothetical protein [Candidatus Cryptobacteroides sp.]